MRRLIFLPLLLFLGLTVLMPATVYAQAPGNVNVLNPVCEDENGNPLPANRRPEVCDSGDDHSRAAEEQSPLTGTNGILSKAMDILALIVGIACVLVIIISGLRFVVSAGDSNAISSARRSLIYAIVGLLIVIAARTLVQFVLRRI